jgi:hypothetical protein
MHDNSTKAFRIFGLRGMLQQWCKKQKTIKNIPLDSKQDYKYQEIFSIWHIDPETDGSDDSCGFTYPKLSKQERDRLRSEAEYEYQYYFGREFKTICLETASCYEIIYSIWRTIRWRFFRKEVSPRELTEISNLSSSPVDNLRYLVYASKHDKDEFVRLWICIYRCQKRFHRRWYQQPKWHIHHWQIRFEWWRTLKRKWKKRNAKQKIIANKT